MTTITREQLHERARRKVKELEFAITQSAFTSIRDGLNDELELARIALASLEENEFIPKNLDKALGVVGVALPESKEEFNFQTERWIQRLIDRVIRYADEFKEQSEPVVPESISVRQAIYALESADCVTTIGQAYKMGWNACRAAMLNGGKS